MERLGFRGDGMNPNANKELIHRWFQALNDHEIEGAVALAADDLVNHAAIPEAQGAAGLRRILGKVLKAFPDATWRCEDVIAEGDRVVCRATMKGTNTGPIEFVRFPIAATGRKCSSEVIHVFRVANGKLAEHWSGRDDLAMMRQLGVFPAAQEVQP
jgi:steroid delta-isomerase-like uncharacterized protein